MRRLLVLGATAVLGLAVLAPMSPVAAAPPSKAQCEKAWYEWQYFSLAPGFPVTLPPKERDRIMEACDSLALLPKYDAQVRLTQKAYNTTAQIVEREVRRFSISNRIRPCEAVERVLKPVGPHGRPPQPGDNVKGFAPDSFLPITRYNWYGGPFRLLMFGGCRGGVPPNLWFRSEPYQPEGHHPDRYPSDEDVKDDPWPRTPVVGPMSTCIAWGRELGNNRIGSEGVILAFHYDPESVPEIRSCHQLALGQDGLDRYPFKVVPNLPL